MSENNPCNNDNGEENEGEEFITIKEAFEEYEEMEKVSVAVLGALDPDNCSYSQGYMKRQALYACLTCNPKNAPFFQSAGVCLACSNHCHDGHELVELYTKRNFRCDCGNKKFPDNPCKLLQTKDDYNEKNLYSQNFSGLYCTCHKPYPDPDENTESADGMIQCVVCEDWYHTKHVLIDIIWNDYSSDETKGWELICHDCTLKCEFLNHYEHLRVKPYRKETNSIVDNGKEQATISNEKLGIGSNDQGSQDSGIADVVNIPSKRTVEPGQCFVKANPKMQVKAGDGTVWIDGWRENLCRCDSCKITYESLGALFLLDEDDPFENYAAAGEAKAESEAEKAEESFNRQFKDLGHIGQIEFLSGMNDLKESLQNFLKEFAENGKIVGRKDVEEFFQNFRSAKRARMDSLNDKFQY